MRTRILVMLLALASNVLGEDEDPEQIEVLKEEYINVFQSMSQLMENMIQAVKENPEILERNDYSTFKRNVNQGADKNTKLNDENDEETDQNTGDNGDIIDTGDKSLSEDVMRGFGYKDDLLSLNPEEIARKAIEIEQELEEYNRSI